MALIPVYQQGIVQHYAIVDDADFPMVAARRWTMNTGYVSTWVSSRGKPWSGAPAGRSLKLHRLLMQPGPGLQVDHVNHDPLDNRRANLRVCTPHENAMNHPTQQNNTSGYRGVFRRGQRWAAKIRFHRKLVHLGTFSDPTSARAAYLAAAFVLFGEFMHG